MHTFEQTFSIFDNMNVSFLKLFFCHQGLGPLQSNLPLKYN